MEFIARPPSLPGFFFSGAGSKITKPSVSVRARSTFIAGRAATAAEEPKRDRTRVRPIAKAVYSPSSVGSGRKSRELLRRPDWETETTNVACCDSLLFSSVRA